jgi:hypothetical protein
MIYINKGEDFVMRHKVLNSNKGVVNLTNASITAHVRTSPDSSTYAFRKRNTVAGGSDSEIETLSADDGEVFIKMDRTDTGALVNYTYYLEVHTLVDGADYIQLHVIKVRQNRGAVSIATSPRLHGSTSERLATTGNYIGEIYFDDDLNTPYFWSGTEWVWGGY